VRELEELCNKLLSRRNYHSKKGQYKIACAYSVCVCEIKLYIKNIKNNSSKVLELVDVNEDKENE
jgi:hypothetical protein